ncbi:LacI family DNA-binding transcriptional regulator [Cellulosimicrobium cellulans]|uniref:LacI family DNA-binding transcriptional regulator n=1 Tax=Cellulosimicrobium cellulans TaxID=1710 RepID=UPI0036F170C6
MNPSRRARRATIKDVADAAGISHATVSRYLNRTSYVSKASGRAIEEAIQQVNYVPNRTARSLVRQETRAVAFIVREHPDMFFVDANLSNMAIGANAALSERDYQMFLLIVDSPRSADRITELITGGFVDGAILVAMHDEDMVTDLARSATPIVTASTPSPELAIPRVDTDNVGGTQRITRMLRETGRTQIAEIRGPAHVPVSKLRHEGFRAAMGDELDENLVVEAAEWSLAAGLDAMRELLRRAPQLDGVVAASDLLAAGAIDALRAHGRSVPDDVAVVGFDDSPWAVRTQPPLSTVRQDTLVTGTRMAELLLQQIGGEDLTGYSEIIPNTVVWRESAGSRPVQHGATAGDE